MAKPPSDLATWLRLRARRTPELAAIVFENETLSYADLDGLADEAARRLTIAGIDHGDRVAFLGLNRPEFFAWLFGAVRVGAVFLPLNFRLTASELSYIITDAGARVVVVDEDNRPVLKEAGDALDGAEVWPIDIEVASDDEAQPATVSSDDVALLMYTSGTTGTPKGAMLTHGNLWWNNINTLLNLDVHERDVTLTAAPLFHIGGLNVLTLVTMLKGGTVLLQRGFDPGAALAAIRDHNVTTMFGVPAMFLFMSQHTDFANTPLDSIRTFVCGGAPCPEALLRVYQSRGVPIQQGYGLTETAPMAAFLSPEHALTKIGSSGRPPLFTDIRLVATNGDLVTEPGDNGEVCVRGPNVMAGYWNRPEDTAAVIRDDGWFHTGDIGHLDGDGFLYITDRVKDMVISGGENVYPAEVESVIMDHPAVADVAVVGTPDEQWGECVTAVVVLQPEASLNVDDLRDFARDRLAGYKLPGRLETTDILPRGATGKVLKFQLRESLLQGSQT